LLTYTPIRRLTWPLEPNRLIAVHAWPYPRLIAHRGGGSLAPENTLAALEMAARYGCRAVEVDARLSADGTPFLIHDDTLDRTTDGTGPVFMTEDARLRSLDAGRWFGTQFAGEPLPTLLDALRRCLDLGLWANVEIKADAGEEARAGEVVARVVVDAWSGPPPLLSSFSAEALEGARRVAPVLPRALLVRKVTRAALDAARRLGCVAIHCRASKTGPSDVAAAHAAGLAVACYTVNDPAQAQRLLSSGVDAVFTDRLDRIPGR
jgi:glycerophosphoryl diester phosphodiesterase